MLLTVLIVAPAEAVTVVSGSNDVKVPLTIDPSTSPTDPQTKERDLAGAPKLAFVQRMPITKTVSRVTVGDLSTDSSCTTPATARLHINEHVDGNYGTSTQVAYTTAYETLPATPGKVSWTIPTTTFHQGRGYSFQLAYSPNCRWAQQTTWAHNEPKVNPGPTHCGLGPPASISGSTIDNRMWHVQGANDAGSCVASTGFDPSMPTGWLVVHKPGTAWVVRTAINFRDDQPAPGPNTVCGSTAAAAGGGVVRWRTSPNNPGSSDYVCVWPQWMAFDETTPHGWYYGIPWYSNGTGTPRDVYLKLQGPGELEPERFRPNLYFDSAEPFLPLDIPLFFAEKEPDGTPAHEVCDTNAVGPCQEVDDPADLRALPESSRYLNVYGEGSDENYRSPECPANLTDCPERSGIYYHVAPDIGHAYRFIDYWWFYRYNDVPDVAGATFAHEGDWEGVTLAFSEGTTNTFDFAQFSEHGTHYNYMRENLSCEGSYAGTCGTEESKSGTRVSVYVAKGTHANYAEACEAEPCFQNNVVGTEFQDVPISTPIRIPEARHDGGHQWAQNNDSSALKEFPLPGSWDADGPRNWTNWPGLWGANGSDGSPRSPGNQEHFNDPAAWSCAKGNECSSGSGSSSLSAAISQDGSRTRTVADCASWLGGSVAALVCDHAKLEAALSKGELGETDGPSIQRAGERAPSAPGISQLLGASLRPGESLLVESGGAGTDLFVRAIDGDRAALARFDSISLRSGERATVAVSRVAGLLQLSLTPEGGLPIAPTQIHRSR